jgi:hypothetical protein
MGEGWVEQLTPRRDVRAVAFVDLGTVRDPSVIAVGFELDGRARGCPRMRRPRPSGKRFSRA